MQAAIFSSFKWLQSPEWENNICIQFIGLSSLSKETKKPLMYVYTFFSESS
jgi:hypothetical protein